MIVRPVLLAALFYVFIPGSWAQTPPHHIALLPDATDNEQLAPLLDYGNGLEE